MIKISELYRYPIKSMGGETLLTAQISPDGIVGDRVWALKDPSGRILSAKRFGTLMNCRASFTDEPSATNRSTRCDITWDDATVSTTSDPEIEQRLSSLLDTPVALWPIMPRDQLEHYRRVEPSDDGGDPTDFEADIREVFGRLPDEPLPDLSGFPPELFAFESPPGTYFDAYPLMVMSTTSLASMRAANTESSFDVRRFRPNIVVDTDEPGRFPEHSWIGRTMTVGSVTLKFENPCMRCVMTTHPVDELPRDRQVIRSVLAENDGNLGVYASVVAGGTIEVDDNATLG